MLPVVFVIANAQHRAHRSPTKLGWWSRVLVAALFAFYLNYIPLHLATATHLDGLLESVAEAVFHQDGPDDVGHSHDTDHHVPHPAAEHTLNLTAQTQASSVAALAVFLLPVDNSVLLCEPKAQPTVPVFERIWPPGDSPPDPLQPRAPPLA